MFWFYAILACYFGLAIFTMITERSDEHAESDDPHELLLKLLGEEENPEDRSHVE